MQDIGLAVSLARRLAVAPRRARGQAMVEYITFTAAIFGFSLLGWPFLLQMLSALDAYFQSLYYVIQSPLP